VCANGSTWEHNGYSPMRPERDAIPGTDAENVTDVATAIGRALADPASLGEHVLILDETDGYLPLGLAEVLSQAGVDVEIVTPHLFIGADLLHTLDMPHVIPRLRAAGIRMTSQQFVESIDGNDVALYDVWGGPGRTVQADTIVISMMRRPNEALYFALSDDDEVDIQRVGDVVAPRKLEAIIYEAEELARRI
jgi:hypothetical protein